MVDENVRLARRDERARARASSGASSTIATSPLGVTGEASTAGKKLIGT